MATNEKISSITKPWKSFHNQGDPSITEKNLKKESSVFLYNKNTGEYVSFNLIPESLQETYKPRFVAESGIYGRSTPLYFYSGGDDKTLSFSFSIHEDLLQGYTSNFSSIETQRSIYKFLDKIKKFSLPVIGNQGSETQTLIPPKVYLQIGNQFAGTGFLTTGWNFSVPYRDGRYIKVDMNISFTYQLEYASPGYLLGTEDNVKLFDDSIMFDLNYITGPTEYITPKTEDLLPEYLEYEYLRSYAYEDTKLEAIALSGGNFSLSASQDILSIRLIDTSYLRDPMGVPDPNDTYFGSVYLRYQLVMSRGPYFSMLDYYKRELVGIIKPSTTPSSRIDALNKLLKEIRNLKEVFTKSKGMYVIYADGISGSVDYPYEMTTPEKVEFEKQLKQLYVIIYTQLTYLTSMTKGSEQ